MDNKYYREQAEICISLAQATSCEEAADELLAIAIEYQQLAIAAEQRGLTLPASPTLLGRVH